MIVYLKFNLSVLKVVEKKPKIKKDQNFYTINNNEINIKKNTPVITDRSNKILALPGLIGGSYAKVNKNTKN